ncbi:MAG: hypothetical protein FWG28_06405 [Clostridiales bacterium]|nr:hypothetical protein [Clostridiales bacterium]
MNDTKNPSRKEIDLDKEVEFTWPEGINKAAAVLDFVPDDEKLAFIKALSRTLQ